MDESAADSLELYLIVSSASRGYAKPTRERSVPTSVLSAMLHIVPSYLCNDISLELANSSRISFATDFLCRATYPISVVFTGLCSAAKLNFVLIASVRFNSRFSLSFAVCLSLNTRQCVFGIRKLKNWRIQINLVKLINFMHWKTFDNAND